MTVNVVSAVPEHIDAIVTLLAEMDRFYGETSLEPAEVRVQQVEDALFSTPPAAFALLALRDGQPVGIASYSFLWPAMGLTRSLYLKELFVTETQWRTGVGTALMRTLLQVAAEHGCSRVEWTTDDGNGAAQRFYKGLGLKQHPDKLFYRADRTMIERQLP